MRHALRTTLSAALTLGLFAGTLLSAAPASAHCQIPCGIYGDEMRFDMLREHVTTIEKSMNMINELSGDAQNNVNQLVRWTVNKEEHADAFVEIVRQYFLQQRIKPVAEGEDGYEDYLKSLELCHHMLVHAMKAKQTTDLEHTKKLAELVDQYHELYTKE
jgi:nickel superoxide dismutase